MLGSLHEVRPGRTIYIETFFGNPNGQLAPSNLVALLVIGCNCRHQQASVKQQRESLHHMPANLPETALAQQYPRGLTCSVSGIMTSSRRLSSI